MDMYAAIPIRRSATFAAVLLALAMTLALACGRARADTAAAATPAPGTAGAIAGQNMAANLDGYLAAKRSPLAGQGAAFVASGGAWQIDPRLLVAIAGAESSFGQITCGPFNAWGYGCPNNPYGWNSWADAIDTVAKGLRTNYLAEGRTSVPLINAKYAPIGAGNDPTNLNSNWTINVSHYLSELGGDPGNVDTSGVAGTYPIGPTGGGVIAATGSGTWGAQQVDTAGATAAEVAAPAVIDTSAAAPTGLSVQVRNSGDVPWAQGQVRLRRVDDDPRVGTAPYAALKESTVAAGSTGTFTIDATAMTITPTTVTTLWRFEGPAGFVDADIPLPVEITTGDMAYSEVSVEAPAPGNASGRVVVRMRNVGRLAWQRDGADAVVLGVEKLNGPAISQEHWISPTVITRLAQRTVDPGSVATFAFPVSRPCTDMSPTIVDVRPFTRSGWIVGLPVRFQLECAGI